MGMGNLTTGMAIDVKDARGHVACYLKNFYAYSQCLKYMSFWFYKVCGIKAWSQ